MTSRKITQNLDITLPGDVTPNVTEVLPSGDAPFRASGLPSCQSEDAFPAPTLVTSGGVVAPLLRNSLAFGLRPADLGGVT